MQLLPGSAKRFIRRGRGARGLASLAAQQLLALAVLCAPLACRADRDCYAYTDSDGVLHLTNVPDDARYRVIARGSPAPAAAPAVARAGTAPAAAGARVRPYDALVRQTAAQYGIDPALVHAVIAVESGYDPKAVSHRGAMGLMQLMPETARRYGVADLFDPAANVRGGVRYLMDLLKLFDNDLRLALAAYNAGEAAVIKYGRRIPPYPETAAYVPRVVSFYDRLRTPM